MTNFWSLQVVLDTLNIVVKRPLVFCLLHHPARCGGQIRVILKSLKTERSGAVFQKGLAIDDFRQRHTRSHTNLGSRFKEFGSEPNVQNQQ